MAVSGWGGDAEDGPEIHGVSERWHEYIYMRIDGDSGRIMVTMALRWSRSNGSGDSKKYEQERSIVAMTECRSC